MDNHIRVKYVPLRLALMARRSVTAETAAETIVAAFGELFEHIENGGGVGPEETAVLFPADFGEPGVHDIAVTVTVADGMPGPGIDFDELAGGEMATLVHVGPYSELEGAWDELNAWVSTCGRAPVGMCREVYRNSAADVPEGELVTELQQPLE